MTAENKPVVSSDKRALLDAIRAFDACKFGQNQERLEALSGEDRDAEVERLVKSLHTNFLQIHNELSESDLS